jgi:signal transduction histidine kinase
LDTKWKSKLQLFVWILLLTFGVSGILSFLDNGHRYFKKDYFQTEDFNGQLDEFIEYISVAEINHQTEEELKKNINVTDEEIEEHRTRYGSLSEQVTNLKGQYQPKIEEAKAAENADVVKLYEQQRDEKINDIIENFKSDEHVKRKIIKEKEKQIDSFIEAREKFIANYHRNHLGFHYYLEDNQTKEVFTNIKNANNANDLSNDLNLFERKFSSSESGYLQLSNHYTYLESSQNEYPAQEPKTLQGIITLSKPASSGNWISDQYYEFKELQTVFYVYFFSSIVALCLALFWAKKLHPVRLIANSNIKHVYNKIPIDIQLLIFFFSIIFMSIALVANNQNISISYSFYLVMERLTELSLAVLLMGITLVQGIWIYPNLRKRKLYKEALIVRTGLWFYRLGSDAFYNRSVGIQILLLLMVIFLSGFGAGVVFIEPEPDLFGIYAVLFLAVTTPVLLYLFKRIGFFNRIIQHSNELAAGKLEQDLPHQGNSALAVLAGNLNLLKHGVKTSKKAEAKSERLKTELITNVSHDLRTPLTSIITYTELLKAEGLTKEDHDSYLEIIDRKSKRLKILIDDLFEASKMASGNIELNKQKVDIFQLLQQAMAEYNETIKKSSLTFRVTAPKSPIFTYVDGQKMWRVFDNLIGNVLKYSLENTRVYVSVVQEKQKVIISFKNVSEYELGGNVEELFERFKRGDTSRHTDGSGLGLAIAKSIVDLHEGSMEIDVDGDLFKVTIELDTMES